MTGMSWDELVAECADAVEEMLAHWAAQAKAGVEDR